MSAGTEVVRVHDQHRVTAELEEGADAEAGSIDELPPLHRVVFESRPAIAPKGQQEMPFASVKFLFTNMTTANGQCACKVSCSSSLLCTYNCTVQQTALYTIGRKAQR